METWEPARDSENFRRFVECVCVRLGTKRNQAFAGIVSVGDVFYRDRPISIANAQKVFTEMERLVKKRAAVASGSPVLTRRDIIEFGAWRGRLFRLIRPAAMLLSEAQNATDDLCAHIEAAFTEAYPSDHKARPWRQYGKVITAAVEDYFRRYERRSRPVLEWRFEDGPLKGHPVFPLARFSDDLRPRCESKHGRRKASR